MTRAISDAQYIARENGDELHLHFLRDVLSAERAAPERVMSLLAPYRFDHRGNRSAIASCAQSALASRIDIIIKREFFQLTTSPIVRQSRRNISVLQKSGV